MRRAPLLASIFLAATAACTDPPVAGPEPVAPVDLLWERSLRPGDLVVAVPGTGSYDYLGATIDALPGDEPLADVRAIAKVKNDAVTFEQALATARRAGFTDADVEAGAITFGIWGAGFRRVTAFTYQSYDGVRMRFEVIGGTNACAVGLVLENLVNYLQSNADKDARDLHARIAAWLAAHPAPAARNVVVVSHSWGGAVAEYLALEHAAIAAAAGPLPDGAAMPFTVAAGVPAYVPGYVFTGPGARDLADGFIYEIDRPDDPVHAMNPSGDGWGHDYNIVIGDDFLGSYGITTTELACQGVPGECPHTRP